MKKWLIIESGSWADEFDLCAFTVAEAETKNEALNQVILSKLGVKNVKDISWPTELYFGTNESQSYGSLSEMKGDLTTKEISDDEAKVLTKLLGDSFGVGAIVH